MVELSGTFLFGLSDGGKLRLVLGYIEYGGDNLLHIVEDGEDLLHDAVVAVFLGVMLDVFKSLCFKSAYSGDVGQNES